MSSKIFLKWLTIVQSTNVIGAYLKLIISESDYSKCLKECLSNHNFIDGFKINIA